MTWFAVTVVSLAVAILSHAALMRLAPRLNPVVGFMGCGVPAGIGLGGFLLRGRALDLAAGLTLYAFLCELYIFAFTFVISSIAVSILLGLRQKDRHAAAIAKPNDDLTARRIAALERNGFLRRDAGRTMLTRKGSSVVFLFQALRGFFRHDGR